jgi:hypothetical protein
MWDFKVGYRGFPQDLDPDPPNALVVADHLVVARYLMEKICGSSGLVPKWDDLTVFVSTPALREPGSNHAVEAAQLKERLAYVGDVRHIPHPYHGGYQCIEVCPVAQSNPYKMALDVLNAVWPLEPQEVVT